MTTIELDHIINLFDTIPPQTTNEKELLHLATHMRAIIKEWAAPFGDTETAISNAANPFYGERTER